MTSKEWTIEKKQEIGEIVAPRNASRLTLFSFVLFIHVREGDVPQERPYPKRLV
jgi:hypothetical protein